MNKGRTRAGELALDGGPVPMGVVEGGSVPFEGGKALQGVLAAGIGAGNREDHREDHGDTHEISR